MFIIFAFIVSCAFAKPLNCTVAGHGPYHEEKKICLFLAKQQAETNCKLTDASADVEYVWAEKTGKVHAHGTCHSEYTPGSRDCANAKCRELLKQNQ